MKNVDPGDKEDEGQSRDAARSHSNRRRRTPGRGPASCKKCGSGDNHRGGRGASKGRGHERGAKDIG